MMPEDRKLSDNDIWDKFVNSIISIMGLTLHEKIYEIYMYDLMKDCIEEGL